MTSQGVPVWSVHVYVGLKFSYSLSREIKQNNLSDRREREIMLVNLSGEL